MSADNKKVVYTNDNCIGCNSCIRTCPVITANVAKTENGNSYIAVNDDACIRCGHCISNCSHDARCYNDSTHDFLDALKSGEKISIAIDPSFYFQYKEDSKRILTYLKSLGVDKIYNVSFGADLMTYAYLNYFKNNRDEYGICPAYISSTCPSVVNFIERHYPNRVKNLIPIYSPSNCLAIYIKRVLHDENRLAFLSPCVAKVDESKLWGAEKYDFYVTFYHLLKDLKNVFGVRNFDVYEATEPDLKAVAFGTFLPMPGGLKDYLEFFLDDDDIVISSTCVGPNFKEMIESEEFNSGKERPLMLELLGCEHGCVAGPAGNEERSLFDTSTALRQARRSARKRVNANDYVTREERFSLLDNVFKDLDLDMFNRSFSVTSLKPDDLTDEEYEMVFNDMGKITESMRHIDCRSCGYESCKDMAYAIGRGCNHKENCINYMGTYVRHIYSHDKLTGLYNRSEFQEILERKINSNPDKRMFVAVCDVNNFRLINDMYGYEGGDKVLKGLAESIHKNIDDSTNYARIGSDSFGFVGYADDKLLDIIRDNEVYDLSEYDVEFAVTARTGVFIVDDRSISVKNMLDYAMLAADTITDKSKNHVAYFDKSIRDQMVENVRLASMMRHALLHHEFKVYYQPQYDHSNGKLTGAEALCRWIRNDGEMIPPSKFIPLFEQNGFIVELDHYMWECVFDDMSTWLKQGINPVPVSINLSRKDFNDEGLVEFFESLLKRYEISPEYVHLEITESAFVTNKEYIISQINKLKNLGFNIAMDDFGAGYSTLNALKDIPIDILKLDTGFFNETKNVEKGGTIISSIIRMARSMSMKVIAEGVETVEQADFLGNLGCFIIQGYLYSKPVPRDSYDELLRSPSTSREIERIDAAEVIDSIKFFDPKSVENKVFDYYSGPASIIEFTYPDKVEVIRNNAKLINFTKSAFPDKEIEDFDEGKLVSSADREKIGKAFAKCADTRSDVSCLIDLCDGENVRCNLKVDLSFIGNQGRQNYIFMLVNDISSEKKAWNLAASIGDELKVKNALFEELLYRSPMMTQIIKIMNVSSENKLSDIKAEVIYSSKGFIENSGYTDEEIKKWDDKAMLKVVHPLDRSKLLYAVLRARSDYNHERLGKTYTYSYRGLNKSGKYSLLKVVWTNVRIEGENDCIYSVVNYFDLDTNHFVRNRIRGLFHKNEVEYEEEINKMIDEIGGNK
ncbi:MAG: EAL domain-containing protein [Lachnospiraceae bacterium]|nr:EAL domain-containing protein [Lachnospiraceae bacterium]